VKQKPAVFDLNGGLKNDQRKDSPRFGGFIRQCVGHALSGTDFSLFPPRRHRLKSMPLNYYGVGGAGGGILNFVSSTGAFNLASVNFRVEVILGSPEEMRIVNGIISPSTFL
jgi:hypothetical protein